MASELPSIGRSGFGGVDLKTATEAGASSLARPVVSAGRAGESRAHTEADEGRRAGVIVRLSGGKVVPVKAEPAEATGEANAKPGQPELERHELREVDRLKDRDREVRAHEQAHKAAAGQHGGAISLSYRTGPDGRRYAVSGEVPVDLSPVRGDPGATVRKMTQIRQAALAPADPSAADRAAASRASALLQEAQADLAELQAKRMEAARGPVKTDAELQKEAEAEESGRAAPEAAAGPAPDAASSPAAGRTSLSFYA